jgi:hypothetical protein
VHARPHGRRPAVPDWISAADAVAAAAAAASAAAAVAAAVAAGDRHSPGSAARSRSHHTPRGAEISVGSNAQKKKLNKF